MEITLGNQLIHVTEMAAIAAARGMGSGDRKHCDRLATESMRTEFNKIDMHGRIVIGEGERDEAPMLFIGEELGTGTAEDSTPNIDIAVDPLENTNAAANGTHNAIAVLATAERGGLFNAPDVYMDKIVVGPLARGKVNLDASPGENVRNIAKAYNRDPEEIVVSLLDRERHADLIRQVREAGARIHLIGDGDLSAGITAAIRGTGIHAVMGIGGAPEAVLTAAAMRCLGGEIQARLVALSPDQEERLAKHGLKAGEKLYHTQDLAPGEHIVFSATGVTAGDLLKGVRFFGGGARTETLVMSMQSRKVRFVDTIHRFDEGDVQFSIR
jgi:fructose-1,6-bisphosphatase class II